MKTPKFLSILFTLTILICLIPLISFAQINNEPTPNNTPAKTTIARIWHGRTLNNKADEYYTYLLDAGIKKIESIPGNLGTQVLRRTNAKDPDFNVISYWESRSAIKKFAGNDIEKARYLPRDKEYLLELEPNVKHFDVLHETRK